jgi:hypothetical protein
MTGPLLGSAFSAVAFTTLVTLAIVELHVELVAGAAAFLVAWWLLREDTPRGQPDAYPRHMHRIFTTSVASVYPHYVTKVEKKGRTQAELDEVIEWLTGFDGAALEAHLAQETTFEDFFAGATLNPRVALITGSVCGVKVQEVADPLMRQIRYLDKLVDELAGGRPMEKVLRS